MMAIHPTKQPCGDYHESTMICSYCRWILEGGIEEALKDYEASVDRPMPDNLLGSVDLTNEKPDKINEPTCPRCTTWGAQMQDEEGLAGHLYLSCKGVKTMTDAREIAAAIRRFVEEGK